mgnify:CR=1 FL=1
MQHKEEQVSAICKTEAELDKQNTRMLHLVSSSMGGGASKTWLGMLYSLKGSRKETWKHCGFRNGLEAKDTMPYD